MTPPWMQSERESLEHSLHSENTPTNFPDKPKHNHLIESDTKVEESIHLARVLEIITTDEQVPQILQAENDHLEKQRRQEVLFKEGVSRLISFATGVLEDPQHIASSEQRIGLEPGTINRLLEKFQILSRLDNLSIYPDDDKYSTAAYLHQAVSLLTCSDRISRSSSQWGLSDIFTGRMYSKSFNPHDTYEEPILNYRRESQGPWGTLLSLKFRDRITESLFNKIPDEESDQRFSVREKLDVVAGTSGMGLLHSLIDIAPPNSPIYYSNTCYFEILPKDGTNIMTYQEILERIKRENVDSTQPTTIVIQPYSSSPGLESISLDLFITELKQISGGLKKPLNIIVDATMIPIPTSVYDDLALCPELANVKLTSVWSLIKHGQIGLDSTMGGIAITYGQDSKALRDKLVKTNGFVSEEQAANLLPHSLDTMEDRINTAGTNAEIVEKHLKQLKTQFELFQLPTLSSKQSEYKTGPCLVFLPVHPSITGLQFPEAFLENTKYITEGTSYGFDKTRIEFIPDINGNGYLRIAAGQEGPLSIATTLNELTEYLKWAEKKVLNDFRFRIEDLEYKATGSSENEEFINQGITQEEIEKSKILLLSTIDNFEQLPLSARNYIRETDYFKHIDGAREFVSKVSSGDTIAMLTYLLNPLTKLNSREFANSSITHEIAGSYDGIVAFAKNIPLDSSGNVDANNIAKYISSFCNENQHFATVLLRLIDDLPLKDYSDNSYKIPKIVRKKLDELVNSRTA